MQINKTKILNMLFPSLCEECGYLGEALCGECYSRLKFEPHVRKIGDLKVCTAMYFEEKSLLDRLVHPFKYSHQEDLYRYFVPQMVRALSLLLDPACVVLVPVPLHKSRLNERGYNQSAVLSKWISRETGCGYLEALARNRETHSQAAFSARADRIKNLAGAFSVVRPLPAGQIVIVDDIVTTGGTLLACREALCAAGKAGSAGVVGARPQAVLALTIADNDDLPFR